MPNQENSKSRLTHVDLAAIDLTITAMQAGGATVGDASRDDNPREQMATALADAHHPLVELTDQDIEIMRKIRDLAGQLSTRTSLRDLLDLRAQIIKGGM